jgi:hypothetical protein
VASPASTPRYYESFSGKDRNEESRGQVSIGGCSGSGTKLFGAWALEHAPDSEAATVRYLDIPAVSFVGRAASEHNLIGSAEACSSSVPLSTEAGNGAELKGMLAFHQGSYLAPVQLPAGVTINSLSLFADDEDSDDNPHAYLVRKAIGDAIPAQGGYVVMAHTASSGSHIGTMEKYTDSTVNNHVINNQGFTYFIEYVDCSEEVRINGIAVQIKYTAP